MVPTHMIFLKCVLLSTKTWIVCQSVQAHFLMIQYELKIKLAHKNTSTKKTTQNRICVRIINKLRWKRLKIVAILVPPCYIFTYNIVIIYRHALISGCQENPYTSINVNIQLKFSKQEVDQWRNVSHHMS